MQKAIAYLLTALILINLLGGYTAFILEQRAIKSEMQSSDIDGPSANAHETLYFSNNAFSQLTFIDNGNELQLDGKLYDVIGVTQKGNQFCVTVQYDTRETGLIERFSNSFGQQQDKEQNSSPLKSILSHFQQDYVATVVIAVNPQSVLLTGAFTNHRNSVVSSFVANTLAPPPKFFMV